MPGWDFEIKEMREKAEKYIEEEKPLLLIGSPMFTAFSQLQRMGARDHHSAEKMRKAVNHMKFVTKMYEKQMQAGRLFLHEHPASASSWQLACVTKLAEKEDVQITTTDLCMFGLKTTGTGPGGDRREMYANKRTKFMTNSPKIAEELSRRSKELHAHQRLIGGKRAEAAARYPPELCKAICRGLQLEMREKVMGIRSLR